MRRIRKAFFAVVLPFALLGCAGTNVRPNVTCWIDEEGNVTCEGGIIIEGDEVATRQRSLYPETMPENAF